MAAEVIERDEHEIENGLPGMVWNGEKWTPRAEQDESTTVKPVEIAPDTLLRVQEAELGAVVVRGQGDVLRGAERVREELRRDPVALPVQGQGQEQEAAQGQGADQGW